MIKILVTVAVLGAVGNFADLAMAQDKQDEAFVAKVSAVLAKREARCAHRRIMPPDPHDNCFNRLRGDKETDLGQGGASAEASGAGPGNGGGQGNGIGPGNGGGRGNGLALGLGNGGGQGRGRR